MTATVRGISVEGRSGTFGDDASREYTVIYKVVTDNPLDGPASVFQAVGVPDLGSIYAAGNDFDTDAVVVSKSVRQGDAPWEWEVELTCSTEVDDDPGQQQDNPLLEPAEISYSFESRRRLIQGYYNSAFSPPTGKDLESGIVAPNGELFVPQPEMDISEPVLQISRNVQSISGPVLMSLADTVNSSPFQGADARQLRMSAPQAQRKWSKSIGFYWNVKYALHFRWDTWDVQILNQGTYFWTGGKPADVTSTTPDYKKDKAGNPVIVNLKANGDINRTGTMEFTRFRVYREIDFNSLGII